MWLSLLNRGLLLLMCLFTQNQRGDQWPRQILNDNILALTPFREFILQCSSM